MRRKHLLEEWSLTKSLWAAVGSLFVLSCCSHTCAEPGATSPEEKALGRAVAYLSREVPHWQTKNKCYSCHNNGDAARALAMAKQYGFAIDNNAFSETGRWLSHPERWKHNGGEGASNDRKLASIQFSAALVELINAETLKNRHVLLPAATIVARYQSSDGSWKIDADGSIGSPVTYGQFLATTMSLHTLTAVDDQHFIAEIKQARRWLRAKKPKTVLDAAAVLIGLGSHSDVAAAEQREYCVTLIRKGQHKSGGWGPFVTSPAEAFDTAVVLLGLSQSDDSADRAALIQRGRQYLLQVQYDDGSWLETTRPAGAESYAQRVSTTAWATIALLKTTALADKAQEESPASRKIEKPGQHD